MVACTVFLAVLLSTATFAGNDAALIQSGDIARSVEWRRLLHFPDKVPMFGKDHSRADSKFFFIHPNGNTSPQDELNALIEALRNPEVPTGKALAPAACSFPARSAFVRRYFPDLPQAPNHLVCNDLEEWREGLNAAQLTLVFASSYPNNPASMFGHTLLRLDPKSATLESDRPPHDLMSYVVHFSAQTDDEDSPWTYMAKGLFGGYPGQYLIAPYYEMVNIYSSLESRDLWEFPLKMSPSSMERLQFHLWELMHNAWFDYWFIDENCSYQILALLDAAEPAWTLTQQHQNWVLPLDTIRTVMNSAQSGHEPIPFRRPSLREKTLDIMNASSGDAENLDVAIARLVFKKTRNKGKLTALESTQLQKLLSARASQGTPSTSPTTYAPPVSTPVQPPKIIDSYSATPPTNGHPSHAAWTGIDSTEGNRGLILGLKGGMHNLSDNPAGYASGSSIDFLSAEVVIPAQVPSQHIHLRRASLIEVTSLTPFTTLDPQWSWRAAIGGQQRLTCSKVCSLVWQSGAEGLGGLTMGTLTQDFQIWILGGARLSFGRKPDLSPLLKTGMLWRPNKAKQNNYLPRHLVQASWQGDVKDSNQSTIYEYEVDWAIDRDLSAAIYGAQSQARSRLQGKTMSQVGLKATRYF